jgi:hypothetical protein
LLVVAFIAAITVLIAAGVVKECPLALFGSEHEADAGALCRAEFLLNRYQALVAALIALAAAIYAVRPVWQQLRVLSVQAASDLLPNLRHEESELSEDEGFLAIAGRVADGLFSIEASVKDGIRLSSAQVGKIIGQLNDIALSINGLAGTGATERFANRIGLNTVDQQRRNALVTALNNVVVNCGLTMAIIKPPGGMPIDPYYNDMAPAFAQNIRTYVPEVLGPLKSEIARASMDLAKMKADLQSRSELATRIAKGFFE